jgi:hypothetical protein
MQHEKGADCFSPFGGYAGFQADIKRTIKEHGLMVLHVSDEPGFTYTIGLYEKYGFELLVFALQPQHAQAIFNDIYVKLSIEGVELSCGVDDPRWANLPTRFYNADPDRVRQYVVQADAYYGQHVRVLQLVLPDRDGLFPGNKDFDAPYMEQRQPLMYAL